MDISTLIGLIVSVLVLLKAVVGSVEDTFNGLSLLIVVVGGVAWTLVAFRLSDVINIFFILKKVLLSKSISPGQLIQKIVGFSETARKEGILALERSVQEADPFMATGIRLAVDGTGYDHSRDGAVFY